jgi:hypothetical protein
MFPQIRCAILAESALAVPAHLRAYPFAAEGTLTKLGTALVNGRLERRIPCGSPEGVFQMIDTPPGVRNGSAEERPRGFEHRSSKAHVASNETRSVTVPALVTEELELKPRVVGVVVVIASEALRRHVDRGRITAPRARAQDLESRPPAVRKTEGRWAKHSAFDTRGGKCKGMRECRIFSMPSLDEPPLSGADTSSH